VFDLPGDVAVRPTARRSDPVGGEVHGKVRFEGVSFRYPAERPWTLQAAGLLVAPGTTRAIVGETGSGTTTLGSLVARLDAPGVGAVGIDAANRLVAALPDGYDTVVAARGYRFSGGERRRLAIARMLLRNPRILVLDEATIAIAHRLSKVRNADQVVVLDGGRIVEHGRHEDLLAAGGRYARLAGKLTR
jgi:ATP-binding cassette, subfamily B, bacterial